MVSWARPIAGGCAISVRLQPRAARNAIMGERGTALAVRVTAPPVSGRANEALIRLLAEALDVPPRAVMLIRGNSGRNKVVHVEGVTAAEAATRLQRSGGAGDPSARSPHGARTGQ